MSRRSKARAKERSLATDKPKILKDETRHSVLAIACFALAIFFVLASFHYAGAVGNFFYQWLDKFFGTGFYIIPLVTFLLGLSFIGPHQPDASRRIISSRIIASLAIFFSGLVGLGIIFPEAGGRVDGGWVGHFLGQPLYSLFDVYSLILLAAIIVMSLLIMFDTELKSIRIPFLFRKQLASDNDVEDPTLIQKTSPLVAESGPTVASAASTTKEDSSLKAKPEENIFQKLINPLRRFNAHFSPPPLTLLEKDSGKPGAGDIRANSNIIKRTLQNFGIIVEMDEISIGPSITRYALKPAEGVKLSRIVGLQNDLSLALAAHPLRIEAPIPGKSLVGIEIPNTTKTTVGLASLLGSVDFSESPHPLLVSLGRGITGTSHFANLAKAPHILIAGATGSGKSVVIHTFITSLLYRNPPDRLRFIMIDPKRVELTLYNKIPHLLTPVVTDAKKAILVLKWAIKEMERRYNILESHSVRDIQSYHKNILEPELARLAKTSDPPAGGSDVEDDLPEKMPYIMIIIDELADIMSTYPRELEAAIVRLAQMSRAIGIHLTLSTQRPSVEVLTGLIKANIPSRLALQVASQIDSRTIIDMAGAEKLLGAGDMLYLSGDMSKPIRLQGAFITEDEVKKVVEYLVKNNDLPAEISGAELVLTDPDKGLFAVDFEEADGGDDDDLYEDARETVIKAGKASASYIQRKLKVGYARAARLLDMLEERGVIGPGEGAKQREVYEKDAATTTEEIF